MASLLHENWENDEGDADFAPVTEHADRIRASITPNARLTFSLYASSWFEAVHLCHEHLGYGYFQPVEGVLNHHYTDAEKIEQERYLVVRNLGG